MDRNELRFLNETWNWLQWIVQIRGIVSIVKFRTNRINGYPIKFISLYSMIMMNRQHTCISMVLDISFMKKECWQKSIVLYPRGLTKFGETKFIYLFDIITNFQLPISNFQWSVSRPSQASLRRRWPELVGKTFAEAESVIRTDRPDVHIVHVTPVGFGRWCDG